MSKLSILIVDDEVQLRKILTITLHANDYNVFEATTGKEAIAHVAQNPPDLVLLDLGLPDTSGHEVLKHLRDWYSNPIIIISAQSSEQDIVNALENGANDYLIKPFRNEDLLMRINFALRNAAIEPNMPLVNFQNMTIDFAKREILKDGVPIKLTSSEYSLLALMARNEGKILTQHYLLNHLYGPSHENESPLLKAFIAQIRKKIETDPNRPKHIITETGVGYRFIGSRTV